MSYIEREPLLKILNGFYNHHLTMRNYAADGATFDCISAVIDAPTADVVEVVRCKDCAYYREETSYCLNPHCSSSYYGHRVKENQYCSFGERSENGKS